MLGACVISSVLFHCSVVAQFKCWVSVTAWLQVSFIWQAKENASSRCEGGSTQKTQREDRGSILLLFLYVFSPPSEPALCKLG